MKKTPFRKLLALLAAAVIAASSFTAPCFADSDDTIQIHLPFVSLDKVLEWDFPYSDSWFSQPAHVFSLSLARGSLGLAMSAFRNEEDELPNQYGTYLKAAGFKNISPFGYDRPTSYRTLSGVLASRKIDDFTLIAVVPCGQGYKNEWSGNMYVGEDTRHIGFVSAANILERELDRFILENSISGKIKLWITGFSRAAAVGNITAADMVMSGRFDAVYAYLFGVPRTTRSVTYFDKNSIFNICGGYDPVPQIPPESWGFQRYGQDLFTPAEETDENYPVLLAGANAIWNKITGGTMHNNPEVNYQLHMIIEFVAEMFREPSEYTKEFQEVLMDTMSDKSPENILSVLLTALSQLDELDKRQAYSSSVFEDYLSYVVARHLEQDGLESSKGRWDSSAGIGENLLREHMPLTYLCWLFSTDDADALLYSHAFSRRVVITADADIEVIRNGSVIGGAKRDGTILEPAGGQSVFAVRHGSKTVVNIPMYGTYTIRIITPGITSVAYYDVITSPFFTFGSSSNINTFLATEGVFSFDAFNAEPLTELETVSGRASDVRQIELQYSTTLTMADEAQNSRHVSIKSILQLLFWTVVFSVLFGLVSLAFWLVHRRARTRGKEPSVLYIIVPHLLMAALFAVLTVFFTFNMFSIAALRSVFAGLTVFVMFLLALRGTLRQHSRYNIGVTVFLLAVSAANAFIYQRSSLAGATLPHVVIYLAAMLLLSVLAANTFRSNIKEPS